MITTWLIITCQGMGDEIRETLMTTAQVSHNPHYYPTTPWLEYLNDAQEPIPTIQIYCTSQKDAFRLRKQLRSACDGYAKRSPDRRNPGKEWVDHPLDGRVRFRYTDEDDNDLPPEQLPARMSG
ncbi:hypothetical protein HC891_12385 [Candidatus Gracilibacteria bacterium]|nr:hypothetical protein [Candidatus Gracilibacteria bacterium]